LDLPPLPDGCSLQRHLTIQGNFQHSRHVPVTIVLYDVAADPDFELDRYESDVVVVADFAVTDVVLTMLC
jgi:hypothetical protein